MRSLDDRRRDLQPLLKHAGSSCRHVMRCPSTEDDTLDRDLHRAQRSCSRNPLDHASRCLKIGSRGRVSTSEAWALIRLAADLRDARPSSARMRSTAAWLARAEDEAVRAIETIAIACHCDMGTHETAVRIEQQQSLASAQSPLCEGSRPALHPALRSTCKEELPHASRLLLDADHGARG